MRMQSAEFISANVRLNALSVADLRSILCTSSSLHMTRTVHFTEPGSLALEAAKIEQLGAAHLVGTYYLNLVQDCGVERKNALDALAKADFTNGETPLWSVALGDKRTLKGLNTLFVAFLDFHLDADCIAGGHRREILALQPGSKLLHDWVLRHSFPFLEQSLYRNPLDRDRFTHCLEFVI